MILAVVLGVLSWPILIIGVFLLAATPLILPLIALLGLLGILTNEWLKNYRESNNSKRS